MMKVVISKCNMSGIKAESINGSWPIKLFKQQWQPDISEKKQTSYSLTMSLGGEQVESPFMNIQWCEFSGGGGGWSVTWGWGWHACSFPTTRAGQAIQSQLLVGIRSGGWNCSCPHTRTLCPPLSTACIPFIPNDGEVRIFDMGSIMRRVDGEISWWAFSGQMISSAHRLVSQQQSGSQAGGHLNLHQWYQAGSDVSSRGEWGRQGGSNGRR